MACPMNIIVNDEEGYPITNDELESICSNCGHCIAVCAHGALEHQNIKKYDIKNVEKIEMGQMSNLIKARRSIRKFKDEIVEEEVLNEVFEITRYAPTGTNTQLVNWTVIYDKEKLEELVSIAIKFMEKNIKERSELSKRLPMRYFIENYKKENNLLSFGAPHLVIVQNSKYNQTAVVDSTIALSYFELTANAHGIGTCWAGMFSQLMHHSKELQEFLELPKDQVIVGAMLVGYSEYKYSFIPERKKVTINWIKK